MSMFLKISNYHRQQHYIVTPSLPCYHFCASMRGEWSGDGDGNNILFALMFAEPPSFTALKC